MMLTSLKKAVAYRPEKRSSLAKIHEDITTTDSEHSEAGPSRTRHSPVFDDDVLQVPHNRNRRSSLTQLIDGAKAGARRASQLLSDKELKGLDILDNVGTLEIRLVDPARLQKAVKRFGLRNACDFEPIPFKILEKALSGETKTILTAEIRRDRGFTVKLIGGATVMHVVIPGMSGGLGTLKHPNGLPLYHLVHPPESEEEREFHVTDAQEPSNTTPILSVEERRRGLWLRRVCQQAQTGVSCCGLLSLFGGRRGSAEETGFEYHVLIPGENKWTGSVCGDGTSTCVHFDPSTPPRLRVLGLAIALHLALTRSFPSIRRIILEGQRRKS